MDIEDAHKLRVLLTDEVIGLFMSFFDVAKRDHMHRAMSHVDDPNEKIAYLRSCVIGTLVKQCAKAFVENEQTILSGDFAGTLLDHVDETERRGYACCSAKAWEKIYCASDVVDVELAGNRMIAYVIGSFHDIYKRMSCITYFSAGSVTRQQTKLIGYALERIGLGAKKASVGRSLANEISSALSAKYADEPWRGKLDALDEIVGAACLAHDLGNPPFGHSGEKAISTFFSEGAGAVLQKDMVIDKPVPRHLFIHLFHIQLLPEVTIFS